MKLGRRFLAAGLAALLLTSAAGCAGNSGNTETPQAGTDDAPAVQQEAPSTEEGFTGPSGGPSGKVVEWNWNELMIEHMTEIFGEQFPDVEYETVIVNAKDYMQKLQTSIATGSDVPDILLGESAYRGALLSLNVSENLEAAPYNFDRSELIETVVPMLSNEAGELVGFDQQFCAAGLAYRRDLTQQYFGVSEPDDVAELISTWDKFVEAGLQLKEQTDDVYMMASIGDLMDCIRMQDSHEYINGNEIDITGRFQHTFELAVSIRDRGVPLGSLENGTPAWNASFSEGSVIFYILPTWASKTWIAGNYPESQGQGLWGLTMAPDGKGFTNGGTSIGIYKDSENKETAYEMIRYLYTTKEGAGQMYDRMGYIYSFKDFYEGDDAPINRPGFYDDYYDGQNVGKYFYEVISPTIQCESMGYYSSSVNDAYSALKPLFLMDDALTSEEALEKMLEETAQRAKDATVK